MVFLWHFLETPGVKEFVWKCTDALFQHACSIKLHICLQDTNKTKRNLIIHNNSGLHWRRERAPQSFLLTNRDMIRSTKVQRRQLLCPLLHCLEEFHPDESCFHFKRSDCLRASDREQWSVPEQRSAAESQTSQSKKREVTHFSCLQWKVHLGFYKSTLCLFYTDTHGPQ